MPVVTLTLTLLLWVTGHFLNGLAPDTQSALYLAWAVPLAAGLAARAFAFAPRPRPEARLAAATA
jgi:hypothetical protein